MKQVPLALRPEPQATFETFLADGNEAVVAHLAAVARPGAGAAGPLPAGPVYLWGASGAGKSHLLQAFLAKCRAHGVPAGQPALEESTAFDPAWRALVVDDVHTLQAAAQHRLFALLVEAQAHGVPWLAAGSVPPVDLPLRDDLRTRLGWGAVYALQPLDDARTRRVLAREAARRGFALGDEVVDYLLHRFSRDLPSLMKLLDALDGFALARQRAVTVPLLREMLAEAQA